MPPITLLTDFGHTDPYVGQMKAAILRLLPGAVLVDLSHEVLPHNIVQAAFLLQASYRHFPAKTIFVSVVDPGVGSKRRLLLARHGEHFFLAPDNGLLGFLVDRGTSWWNLTPPAGAASTTFHGRDIFAPLAARLAQGALPDCLGSPLSAADITRLDLPAPSVSQRALTAQVVHVDRFGNCLLNLPAFEPSGRTWSYGPFTVLEADTYAQLRPGRIGLIRGSQGVMELAMNQQSCARTLDLAPGSPVHLIIKDSVA